MDSIEERANDVFHDICDANKHSHDGEGLSILIHALQAERDYMREMAARVVEDFVAGGSQITNVLTQKIQDLK